MCKASWSPRPGRTRSWSHSVGQGKPQNQPRSTVRKQIHPWGRSTVRAEDGEVGAHCCNLAGVGPWVWALGHSRTCPEQTQLLSLPRFLPAAAPGEEAPCWPVSVVRSAPRVRVSKACSGFILGPRKSLAHLQTPLIPFQWVTDARDATSRPGGASSSAAASPTNQLAQKVSWSFA